MPNPKHALLTRHDSYVLVTGATGFIGAHIVDDLLKRGVKVRGATRTKAKGEQMLADRPQWKERLDFVQVADFEGETRLDEAVKDVDAVMHVASPFTFDTTNNEKELVLPAINGVKAILSAASKNPKIRRIVLTSSFAAIVDISRTADPSFTYTAEHWNPMTYEESIAPKTSPVVAYRGSKKFAELQAWNFMKENKPAFDLVTLCPPMVFGPVVHPVADPTQLNESNFTLWSAVSGVDPLPSTRVPLWVDVRDLAKIQVEALLKEHAGGKRYTPASPENFSYGQAATIVRENFPHLARKAQEGEGLPEKSYGLDGQRVAKELGVEYHSFVETVVDFVRQIEGMSRG